MEKWKVTYMDYSGMLRSVIHHGTLHDIANGMLALPNASNGISSILKIEKTE